MYSLVRTVTTFSAIQIPYFPHMNVSNFFLILFVGVLSFSLLWLSAAHHRSGSKWRTGCRSQCPQINIPAARETWVYLPPVNLILNVYVCVCVWSLSKCLSPLCVSERVCVWACAHTWTLWDTGSASLAARPADRTVAAAAAVEAGWRDPWVPRLQLRGLQQLQRRNLGPGIHRF